MVQHLSAAQNSVLSSITNYGMNHGFDASSIQVVRDIGFAESSLGQASNSTHVGLFQYAPTTWAQVYPSLNINSQNDQIQAMFSEVQTYGSQFIAAVRAGNTLYANYTAAEYVDAVHHFSLGNPNPNVTQAQLNSAKAEITAAETALGAFATTTIETFDNDQRTGLGTSGFSFDLQFGWVNFAPTGSGPTITVGPITNTDSYGNTWNLP